MEFWDRDDPAHLRGQVWFQDSEQEEEEVGYCVSWEILGLASSEKTQQLPFYSAKAKLKQIWVVLSCTFLSCRDVFIPTDIRKL